MFSLLGNVVLFSCIENYILVVTRLDRNKVTARGYLIKMFKFPSVSALIITIKI